MASQVNVDVRNGRLVVSDEEHIDLIRHGYDRRSDREILKELWEMARASQFGGA